MLKYKGAITQYTIDNPEITYFKIVYKKDIYIKKASHILPIINPDYGKSYNINISPNLGDLLMGIYLRIVLISPQNSCDFAYINNVGNAIINKIECRIDNLIFNKLTGSYIDAKYKLNLNKEQLIIYNKLIGNIPYLTKFSSDKSNYILYVSIPFNVYPLYKTKDLEMYINLTTNSINDIILMNDYIDPNLFKIDMDLIVNTVYLDPTILPSINDTYLYLTTTVIDNGIIKSNQLKQNIKLTYKNHISNIIC